MSTIRTKAEFYRLWRQGLLGNRPRAWADAAALRASGYSGLVTMRSTGAGGGKTRYRVPVAEALASAWSGCTFNEACPDEELTLQGEAARMVGGLCLTYSTTPNLAMREAMKTARTASGAAALAILDAYLAPPSRDDLSAIWDLYPDAVIEFSAYGRKVGDQPHRNTLIWEVRNY
jgi:hypothetical protein